MKAPKTKPERIPKTDKELLAIIEKVKGIMKSIKAEEAKFMEIQESLTRQEEDRIKDLGQKDPEIREMF